MSDNSVVLEKLHEVLLSIIKDIDKICKENGITYYLAGGSALGAIRHQGFIPWDDDLDILMDIENYEKFKKACEAKLDTTKYYFEKGNTEEFPMLFSKIRLRNTTFLEGYEKYCRRSCLGIYIDIFLLHNTTKNKFYQFKQFLYTRLLVANSLTKIGYHTTSRLKKMVLNYASRLSVKRKNKLLKYVTKYDHQKTELYCEFVGRGKKKNKIYKKNMFGEGKYVPFAGENLLVPAQIKNYVVQLFGEDCMELPPENKRATLHVKYIDFNRELSYEQAIQQLEQLEEEKDRNE